MAGLIIALITHFLSVHGPDGQPIDIAVDQIVSLRTRRAEEEHLHPEVKCQIHTTDGKFIGVAETCTEVERLLSELYQRREEE